MLIDQDKELKNAILNLPVKEKDKMLLKLIGKDVVLLNQLRYQLLEFDDLEQRREAVLHEVDNFFKRLLNSDQNRAGYRSAGMLMMDLRGLSGIVNEHILITKDRLGDVELRLYMIESLFKLDLKALNVLQNGNQKLLAYIAARMKYVLDKYSKLHEDHQFDLRERINKVLSQIKQSAVDTFAEDMKLPQFV